MFLELPAVEGKKKSSANAGAKRHQKQRGRGKNRQKKKRKKKSPEDPTRKSSVDVCAGGGGHAPKNAGRGGRMRD